MFALTPFERKSYDLFNAFHDFERDFFGDERQVSSCKTDIRDEGERFVLEAELPGFDKKDINLDINGGFLTLSAERSSEKNERDDNGRYVRRERSFGSYRRSFDISGINSEQIDAEYKNGVLFVNLPKKAVTAPETKRLEIR
ncbi:MAG: Hsp20/alpha crystallin family protein [Oscillospiraceae bacterium]|nr:Hsp20/alpha crystallin family protein [Oscillospiraceae bacterium]